MCDSGKPLPHGDKIVRAAAYTITGITIGAVIVWTKAQLEKMKQNKKDRSRG